MHETSHEVTWTLPSAVEEVGPARRRAVAEVRGWGVPLDDPSDLEAVLSELVTNSILHAAGVEVRIAMWLHRPGVLALEVHDQSRQVPSTNQRWTPHAGADQESGRGLTIVDSLALAWGYFRFHRRKAAWVHLAVPPFPADPPTGAGQPTADPVDSLTPCEAPQHTALSQERVTQKV